MLCSSSAPAGYSTINTDCDDNNASIHAPVQYYIDNDHDGYGSTTTAMLCSSSAPTGYSTNNTDCDDNSASIHAPVQYYVDNDHDGYGSTTTAMLCSSTAPSGYSTNSTDCNDNNASIHTPLQYYVDNDHDGYGSTTTAMVCSSTPPIGYSTNNTDCNDNDASVHVPVQYYVDNDHDGYGSTTSAMLCSSSAPTGYSTNNTDCNDNDASIHAPLQYYVDNDRDGYGSTTTALICSSMPPAGYSTNNADCNNNDASIHPGATEICDGKDNDCDGQTDEGCPTIAIGVNDATIQEGNTGKKTINFVVTLSQPSSQTITVKYETQNGTATAGSDYIAKSGTLTFKGKTTTQTIGITIYGDKVFEQDETFKVILSNAVNATIARAMGTGTITNDDKPLPAITSTNPASLSTTNRSIKVSPNPAISTLHVELIGYTGNVSMQLLNLQGKVMMQEKIQTGYSKYAQQQFNIGDVASGVYFLNVIDEKGDRQTEKVIVAK